MPKDNVIKLIQPGVFDDQLTEVLRNGARALLTRAVEAEVADFLDKHADLKTGDGHRAKVRFQDVSLLGDRNPLGSPTKAAGRYSHPRSPNAERSTPGGAYHPPVR